VKKNQPVVQLLSPLPFRMPDEKRFDGAIAVCIANYGICDGAFDYDISSGEISFRITSSYFGCTISKELFYYLITVAVSTIERYSERFFKLAGDRIDIHRFMEMDK